MELFIISKLHIFLILHICFFLGGGGPHPLPHDTCAHVVHQLLTNCQTKIIGELCLRHTQ